MTVGRLPALVTVFNAPLDEPATATEVMSFVYPHIEPYRTARLEVSDGHTLYFEECGRPDGLPAVFIHGGPGSGCNAFQRRLFDPGRYRAVFYDQRGCGRSSPPGCCDHNTTSHLVEDLERLRSRLGIDRWIVCGGSWGTTLALLYAQQCPDATLALALRAVFLARPRDLSWFLNESGAARLAPDAYHAFRAAVGDEHPVCTSYWKALNGDDPSLAERAARAWSDWEHAVVSPTLPPSKSSSPGSGTIAKARIAVHYAMHEFFLSEDGAIPSPERLATIPGTIVHGTLDLLTPMENASSLARAWPSSELRTVPGAGHTLGEPAIAAATRKSLDDLATSISSSTQFR